MSQWLIAKAIKRQTKQYKYYKLTLSCHKLAQVATMHQAGTDTATFKGRVQRLKPPGHPYLLTSRHRHGLGS